MSSLRTLICDASGKKICITMPYYVIQMNETAAFFGNYPLLSMWCFYKDSLITSINTSSQSTTTILEIQRFS
ncbi:hypothetical protein T08_929 [Trichinella sp. T8]|nr:hypothetical protein T08_929 [Trichinella sp. T8]